MKNSLLSLNSQGIVNQWNYNPFNERLYVVNQFKIAEDNENIDSALLVNCNRNMLIQENQKIFCFSN